MTSQSFVYKGSKAELHDDDVADRMKAEEGWFDNPTDAKNPPKPEVDAEAAAKKPAAKKAAAKKPAAKKAAAKKPAE